jgi:light-regulated signal transduction histidine kinase (bacteriophytochrome)
LLGTPSDAEFEIVHRRLDDLIQMNQAAMFHSDSRAMRAGDRLASEFAGGLVILLLIGVVVSWTLARDVSRPSGAIKLSWVISNLLANALRYTPPDGVITVSAKSSGRGMQLQVRDTGAGIAPQLQNRLFERFAQWNVNGAQAGSAGLGLAIAKEIVQAHGGRILVDSMVGKGTCFTVELPIDEEFSAKAPNR